MTITENGTITPETPAEIIHYGWEVYRRSQQIPFPSKGGGDLIRAQSRLFHLTAPFACNSVYVPWWDRADLPGIEAAAAVLIAVIGEYCGEPAAEFASGQDRSVAA